MVSSEAKAKCKNFLPENVVNQDFGAAALSEAGWSGRLTGRI
jgi:hypothetical protein